jgi:hypothetical protein
MVLHKTYIPKGFATLEIVLALTILTMAFIATDLVVFGNQSILIDSEQSQSALVQAEILIESARAAAQRDFKSLGSMATTSVDGIYTEKLSFTDADWFAKTAIAEITWNDGVKGQNITLTAHISDFDDTSENDTCDQNLSGDWTHPHAVVTTTELESMTHIDAYEGRLYVSASNESAASSTVPETLFVFDIQDPTHPTLISKLDNDKNKTGITDITVASSSLGSYLYAASESSFARGQLQIFDVSTSSPSLITTFKISSSTVSTAGIGKSIFYRDGYVYLGLTAATGPEFNIIDVHNPLIPVWIGGYDVGNDVNQIYVKGLYAYLATPNSRQLLILDISNPKNPIAVGGFQTSGGIGGNGKSMYQLGNTLYFGETFATTHPELYILNNANQNILLPQFTSQKIGSSVNGVIVRNNLAFLITTSGQFQIWNVASSTNISPYATAITLPNASSGTALDCEGNYMYVGSVDASNKGYLTVITS